MERVSVVSKFRLCIIYTSMVQVSSFLIYPLSGLLFEMPKSDEYKQTVAFYVIVVIPVVTGLFVTSLFLD